MGSINLPSNSPSISKGFDAGMRFAHEEISAHARAYRIKRDSQEPQPTQLSVSTQIKIDPNYNFLENTAEADLSLLSINDMLGRMRALASASAEKYYNANDRQSLSNEFLGLAKELDRVSSISPTTLDGKSSIQLPPGANTTNTKALNIGNFTSEGLGLKNIDLNSAANATSTVEAIDLAITKVDTQRVAIGEAHNAVLNRYNNSGTYTNPSVTNNRSTEAESISASKIRASPTTSVNADRIASVQTAINNAYDRAVRANSAPSLLMRA